MNKVKKLCLSKETLLQLSLSQIQGGSPGATPSVCPMISCDSCRICPP